MTFPFSFSFLYEVPFVGLSGLGHAGMDQVVGKQNVRDTVAVDKRFDVLQKIATVHDVDLLK